MAEYKISTEQLLELGNTITKAAQPLFDEGETFLMGGEELVLGEAMRIVRDWIAAITKDEFPWDDSKL